MVKTHITIEVEAFQKTFKETATLTKRCSVEEIKNYALSRLENKLKMQGYFSGFCEISKENLIILWFYIEEDQEDIQIKQNKINFDIDKEIDEIGKILKQ